MSASRTATISNNGNLDLTVSALNLTGSADFALAAGAPATPLTVIPGGSVDVAVDYTPTGTGSDTGTLEIASDDPDQPSVFVGLSGTEIPPLADQDIDVTPLSVDFGTLEVGQSAAATLTITNLGQRDLTVTALTLGGSADFAFGLGAPATPFAVPQGSTVDVPLRYVPSDVGSDAGTLDIASDDPLSPLVTVALSGNGIAHVPVCTLLPDVSAIDFGLTPVASTATGWVKVRNIGDADCTISATTISGSADFALASYARAVPFTLRAGSSLATGIPVEFTPAAAGPASATLTIASNDSAQPTLTIPLSGTGSYAPDIAVPASLNFGDVESTLSSTLALTVTNAGNSDLTVTGVTLSGSADFTLGAGGPALPAVVAAGATLDVPVTYTPTGGGSDTATVQISSDDPDEPVVSTVLAGNEVPLLADQDIDVTPVSIDFGTLDIGQMAFRTVTIANLGQRDLRVTGFTVTGSADFRVRGNAPVPPFTLVQGQQIQVDLVYQPSDAGADSGSFDIASDDPATPTVSIPLAGNGIVHVPACDLSVSPASVDFGTVSPGGSASKLVFVDNLGDAECVVTAITFTGSSDFALGANPPALPLTLPVNALARGIWVDYNATGGGADSGSITFASNDPSKPTVSVALSGVELLPQQASVSPAAVDLGTVPVGSTASATVTVTNSGDADLTVSALTLAGSADFTLGAGAPGLPLVLAGGTSASVPVEFTASAAGPASATLTVASDDPVNPSVTVSLTASGAALQNASVSPLTVDFGTVDVGVTSAPATVTLTNTGDLDLTVSAVTITGTGEFALGAVSVPMVLAGGASASFDVTYAPIDAGADSATLDISSDDPDQPTVSVSLAGNGNVPARDGPTVWSQVCAGCHGTDPTVKAGRTAADVQNAINSNVGGMGFLSTTLQPAEIQNVGDYLSTLTPPAADGPTLWANNCAGCHGTDPSVKAGRTVTDIQNAIASNTGGMGFISLSTTDLQTLADYLATFTPPPPATDGPTIWANVCAGCHGTDPSVKAGRTATDVQNAINSNLGGMGSLTLTASEIQIVGDYLASLAPPPPPTDGAGLWSTYCQGCHGTDPTVKAGRTQQQILDAIAANTGGMGSLSASIGATEAQLLADYLATFAPTTPAGKYAAYCQSCHGDPTVGGAAPAAPYKVGGARSCSIDFSIDGANKVTSYFRNGVPEMAGLKGTLSTTDVADLESHLNSFFVSDEQRYVTACAGCHGIDGSGGRVGKDVRGENASKVRKAISKNKGGMGFLSCLPTSDTDAIGAFLTGNGGPGMPPPAADGASLWASNCSGCHGTDPSVKAGRTVTDIQNAISSNTGGMGSLSLTATELQTLADYLATFAAPPPATDGPSIWAANCAGCHGADPTVKAGRTATDVQNAINSNFGGMGSLTLTASEIQIVGDYLASLAPPPPPTDGAGLWSTYCQGCHGTDPTVKAGRTQQQILDAIAANTGGMGSLSASIGATEAQLLADYLATFAPTTPQGKYAAYCQSCHGDPTVGGPAPAAPRKVPGARSCSIDFALYGNPDYNKVFPNGVAEMQSLQGVLSTTDVDDVAGYLNSFSVSGQERYVTMCAGCHGIDARGGASGKDVRGKDAKKVRDAIKKEKAMKFLSCLPSSDSDAIGSWLKTQ